MYVLPFIRNKVSNITLIRRVLKRLDINVKLFVQLYTVEKVKISLKKRGLHFKESTHSNGNTVLTVQGGR
jgi:hypothetical protein